MKDDHLGIWRKALRLTLPVLLYLASFMVVRFFVDRICGDLSSFQSLVPTLLMLPIAILCRSKWRNSRIELTILAAVLILSLLSFGFNDKVSKFLGTVIAGPVNEELIYRGCTYEQGKSYLGVKWSACLSALLFAVGHTSLPQMMLAFVMGLIFAFSLEKTRLIEISIGLHSLLNAAEFVFSSM